MSVRWLAILCLILLGGCYRRSCELDPTELANARERRLDVPRAISAPALTADPNDPAWASAVAVSDLTPSIGTKPGTRSLPTTVKLLWDEDFLYVRFICQDDETYIPFQGNQRDREYYRGDAVEVFLDSVGDGRQYYEIQVTPANQVFDQTLLVTADKVTSQWDGRLSDDILKRNWWKDISYDIEGLKTAASRSEAGKSWIVDIAIPAKAALRRLGESKFHAMTLHAHLMRYDWQTVDGQRVLHPLNWAPVVFGCPHQSPAAMGALTLKP